MGLMGPWGCKKKPSHPAATGTKTGVSAKEPVFSQKMRGEGTGSAESEGPSRSRRSSNRPGSPQGLLSAQAVKDDKEESVTKSIATPPKPKVWKMKKRETGEAQISVGTKEQLHLRSLRVMARVEGPRGRTMVDHVFYNPYPRQLQGTFRYKLPDQASMAYFAFYPTLKDRQKVKIGDSTIELPSPQASSLYTMQMEEMMDKEPSPFGKPKIARVVPKEKALHAYEETVRRGIDPALVEWSGANTFSAKVFPISPSSFCRVVIAYDQTLPRIGQECRYEFYWPQDKKIDLDFMLVTAPAYEGRINLKGSTLKKEQGFFSYHLKKRPGELKEDHIEYTFPTASIEVISGRDKEDGPIYVYGRLLPNLPDKAGQKGSSRAVFMLDTSMSQEVNEFDFALQLLKRILELGDEIKEFNILLFNIEAHWWNKKGWIANTKESRKELFSKLKEVLLEGATDLETALQALNKAPWLNKKGEALDVFMLSNGASTWGDPNTNRVVARFKQGMHFAPQFYSYNFGLGSYSRDFFQILQTLGGASYHCHGPAQLDKTAVAHRSSAFLIESIEGKGLQDLLISGKPRRIYPGQELLFGAKQVGPDTAITVKGHFQGQKKELTFKINPTLADHLSSLAPRAFGELVVKTMEGLENPTLEKTIIAYARYFSVPGKTCSLLMLDTQKDYDEFKINLTKDGEKIQKTSVKEILAGLSHSLMATLQSRKSLFVDSWEKLQKNPLVKIPNIKEIARLIGLLSKEDFDVNEKEILCKSHLLSEVSQSYLQRRKANKKDYDLYLSEGSRRLAGSLGDAVRCLSSLVELEPGSSVALRLVGYWLLQHNFPELALGLFERVKEKRSFEPHSYRDLAKCYWAMNKFGTAALFYEIVLKGTWHSRFGQLKTVAQGEYLRLLRQGFNQKKMAGKYKDFLGQRLEELSKLPGAKLRGDVMVTITWNTDGTDVDLWVKDPSGEECGYNHKNTNAGGKLLEDITRGYGPEQFFLPYAPKGQYEVSVNYYSGNRTRLSDRTFVEITLTFYGGSPKERNQSFYVMLTSSQQKVLISRFNWPPEGD